MGCCVSTSNRTHKSQLWSRKCCGKVSAAIPDEPTVRGSDAGNCSIRSKLVRAESSASTRRRSEVSNLTFHLTQLQWHRSLMDLGNEPLPVVTNAIGNQLLQHEDASYAVNSMHEFEKLSSEDGRQEPKGPKL